MNKKKKCRYMHAYVFELIAWDVFIVIVNVDLVFVPNNCNVNPFICFVFFYSLPWIRFEMTLKKKKKKMKKNIIIMFSLPDNAWKFFVYLFILTASKWKSPINRKKMFRCYRNRTLDSAKAKTKAKKMEWNQRKSIKKRGNSKKCV